MQNPHCHTASRPPGWHTPPNWIGNNNLDRLISYPEAPFLSRTELPIQNTRHLLIRGRRRDRPQGRWADDVTNVVKPERFEAPCEDSCYKRRQSRSKNRYFQRKSRWIDDVCNNTQQKGQKTQRGRLAGGPPPTGTHSGPALRAGQRAAGPDGARNTRGATSSPAQQAAGHAKGAGTEVPAPCRLTQPLPRRGSGRMTISPGDGDASTGTCRQRRPLPGQLHRSGHRSRCGRGAASGSAWWPGRRARRNRSSRR